MAEYVTVVEVDDPNSQDPNQLLRKSPPHTPSDEDPSFITVLSINNNNNLPPSHMKSEDLNPETELVVVYRLPGERLGFGLKFQGGTRSSEKVQKLYIQSCAKDSPASKVVTSWGQLREGDEIVKIDERYVRDMTRIECVKGLKDNVAIKLEVRNGRGQKPEDLEEEYEGHMSTFTGGNGKMKGAPPPPPPVPPRKLVKKSVQVKETEESSAQNLEQIDGDKSFTPPPDAEFYINLFAENNGHNHTHPVALRHHTAESESDDTASTISTVIDRYSLASTYSSESDLSGFNSLTNGQTAVINKPELAKVLKPFTLLEQEFNLAASKDQVLNNVLDPNLDLDLNNISLIPGNNYENIEFKTQKINVYENMELRPKEDGSEPVLVAKEEIKEEVKQLTPTPKPRQVLAQVEPKKRSIIPMPRKITATGKQAIAVETPKVPEDVEFRSSGKKEEVLNGEKEKQEMESVKELKEDKESHNITNNKQSVKVESPQVPDVKENKPQTLKIESPQEINNKDTKSQDIKAETPKVPENQDSQLNAAQNNDSQLPAAEKEFSKVQEHASKPSKDSSKSKDLPAKQTNGHSSAKEFITKIPKAILSPLSQQKFLERAKTESEIKLKTPSKLDKLKLQTSDFLEKEKGVKTKENKTPSPTKSRIPIHLTAKRSLEMETPPNKTNSNNNKSPTNIPRRLTKQKSETDLNLNYLINPPSKESSPVSHSKIPLQRAISADTKFKSPDRTLIPILQQTTSSTLTSSTESISSTTSGSSRNRGPKPKPPERVQSLPKTNIPKLQLNNVTTVTVVDRTQAPSSPPTANMPTMQTFKQASPKPQEKPLTPPSPNREIKFKIQTYESKTQTKDLPITFPDQEEQMPSLFELQRRNSPQSQRKSEEATAIKESSPASTTNNIFKENSLELEKEEDLDCTTPPPLVVGKCMKVDDSTAAPLYYSSSSSDDEDMNDSSSYGEEKDYICEDGEKLGPPELINGPGPSEAYFNLYWHSNMLPTIGEVEEECSSLEPQSLTNG